MGTEPNEGGIKMNTFQQSAQNSIGAIQTSSLLDVIAQWPDWKIQALCLDESDLKIKEAIKIRRRSKNEAPKKSNVYEQTV